MSGTGTDSDIGQLRDLAQRFADELTTTLACVVARPFSPLAATAAVSNDGDARVAIETAKEGLSLHVAGYRLLTLGLSYRCSWDHAGQFLAIESSCVRVVPGPSVRKDPLFRYEFVRTPHGRVPVAQLHVHAHRDGYTWLATRAAGPDPTRVPQMQDLHFPLGGARFRPCLEDVLEMLIVEFGVEPQVPDADAILRAGRATWRETQLRAAVRDNPTVAAEVLAANGYAVSPPTAGDPPRRDNRIVEL